MVSERLRKQAKALQPILQVGKNGLTQGMLELLDRELEQKELIKIKFLRAAKEQWPLADLTGRIVQTTKAQVVDRIGNTLVLYRKRGRSATATPHRPGPC